MTRDSPYPYLPCGELVLVAASLMFVVGSICFLPVMEEQLKIGDVLFILGSFIYLGKSAASMKRLCEHHGSGLLQAAEHGAEFFENVCYFLACIVFTLGCVLWWPGIYPDDDTALKGKIIASWCFIWGSLGFVVASFCNAVLLSRGKMFRMIPGNEGMIVYALAFTSLLFSQLGGVFFVTGSYMYRPGFNNHCERHLRDRWTRIALSRPNVTDADIFFMEVAEKLHIPYSELDELIPRAGWCVDINEYGTVLYIVGSSFYFICSILYYIIAVIKERVMKRNRLNRKIDGGGSGDDSMECDETDDLDDDDDEE